MSLLKPIRRILSPRETDRGRGHEDTPPDTPVSASSLSGGRPSIGGDTESVVENVIYSEPTPLDQHQRHSHHRISGGDDPPLPPRPLSGGGSGGVQNSDENETYYQAPVDTLGRGGGLTDQQQTAMQQRMASTRERERAAQERERRQMDMHERTLNQIQGAGVHPVHLQGRVGGLGHRRTRSGGHLIDNDEYSTPWDVQGEQRRRASGHNPPKPARANRRPIPATPSDGNDIIPLSPTTILTGHERSQSASPVPPRSPTVQASGDAEYDDPWDVRNRNISQVIPSQRHHPHSALHDRRSPPSDHRPAMRQSVGSRTEHSRSHLDEVRPSRSLSDRNHLRGGGGGGVSPMEPPEQFRPRTITDVHPHSLSHTNPSSPRTSSMCAPTHPIQRRPLPEEPPSGGATSTVSAPPSVSPSTRGESSILFDSNLALEEQLWYHGAITRAEAEAVLANKRDFSFLVRNSESCRTDYSLSIRDRSSGFIHLRIVYERSGYVLGQFSSHFQTVPECIFFYTQQRLNIRGTDHKKLRYPVPRDHYIP